MFVATVQITSLWCERPMDSVTKPASLRRAALSTRDAERSIELRDCLVQVVQLLSWRHWRTGDPRNLGPGRYQLTQAWKPNTKHGSYKAAPGFYSGAARLAEPRASGPGPNAYEAKDLNKAFKPMVQPIAPFGATDARMQLGSRGTPGPGQYQLTPSWHKRSFNITLDDTMLA